MSREFEDPNRPHWRPCRDCGIYFQSNRPWHSQCPNCWRIELKAAGNGLSMTELSRLHDRSLIVDGFVCVTDESGGGGIEAYSDEEMMFLFRCWIRRERNRIAREHDTAARRRSIRAVPDPGDDDPASKPA